MFKKTRYFNTSFINSIEEDRTYHGNFWKPENPKDKLAGVLSLKREGGITLTLIGMFEGNSEILDLDFDHHPILLGTIIPGLHPVSLVSCLERERRSPHVDNSSKGASQSFKVKYSILGVHCDNFKDLNFQYFEFSTTYLADWLGIKTIEQKFEAGEVVVKSSIEKKKIEVAHQGTKISLSTWSNISSIPPYNFKQEAVIGVELQVAVSVEEFMKVTIRPLFDLIQFGSSHLNSITSLRVSQRSNSKTFEVIIESNFRTINKSKVPLQNRALFRPSDINHTYEALIQNWLKAYNKKETVFNLYFGARHIGFQFPISKFLNIIQALESYHGDRPDSVILKEERENFLARKEKLKGNIDPADTDLKSWIDKHLLYRPTLRARLIELVNETGSVLDSILQDRTTFIDRIVQSRNYYTHFSPEQKGKAAIGLELDALTFAMTLILDYHILNECQIEKGIILELFERSDYFGAVKQIVLSEQFWSAKKLI